MSDDIPGPEERAARAKALESEFLGSATGSGDRADGAPVPHDWVDPELERIDPAAGPMRIVLSSLIVAFALFVAWQYRQEALYFFSATDALDLGAAEELSLNEHWVHEGALSLPSNRYVRLSGVGTDRSGSESREYHRLVGTWIYVESEPEAGSDAPRRRSRTERASFDGPGRLLSFRTMPDRYEGLARYYSDLSGVEFCGVPVRPDVATALARERDRNRDELQSELDREPTLRELREAMGDRAACVDGYLLLLDRDPHSYAWVLGFDGALLIGFGVWFGSGLRKRRGRKAGPQKAAGTKAGPGERK